MKFILAALLIFTSIAFAEPKPGAKNYFATCAAMNKTYPTGVFKSNPAYRKALDFDRNGWACERKFPNCKAMNRVFPNGVPITHPSYSRKLDRDKDRWACERN
jgi:phage FluMu protein Com